MIILLYAHMFPRSQNDDAGVCSYTQIGKSNYSFTSKPMTFQILSLNMNFITCSI